MEKKLKMLERKKLKEALKSKICAKPKINIEEIQSANSEHSEKQEKNSENNESDFLNNYQNIRHFDIPITEPKEIISELESNILIEEIEKISENNQNKYESQTKNEKIIKNEILPNQKQNVQKMGILTASRSKISAACAIFDFSAKTCLKRIMKSNFDKWRYFIINSHPNTVVYCDLEIKEKNENKNEKTILRNNLLRNCIFYYFISK